MNGGRVGGSTVLLVGVETQMAVFTKIKESEAPKRLSYASARLAGRMREYEGYINDVAASNGIVGQIRPDSGETARGLALRVNRAAKRMGAEVETWVSDGTVYFRVSGTGSASAPEAPAPAPRATRRKA